MLTRTVTNNTITLIQGDCLDVVFNLTGEESSLIKTCYFTSAGISFQKELHYDAASEAWTLHCDHDETIKFAAGRHTWDLTATLMNDCVITVVYNETIVVNKKTNEVTY